MVSYQIFKDFFKQGGQLIKKYSHVIFLSFCILFILAGVIFAIVYIVSLYNEADQIVDFIKLKNGCRIEAYTIKDMNCGQEKICHQIALCTRLFSSNENITLSCEPYQGPAYIVKKTAIQKGEDQIGKIKECWVDKLIRNDEIIEVRFNTNNEIDQKNHIKFLIFSQFVYLGYFMILLVNIIYGIYFQLSIRHRT